MGRPRAGVRDAGRGIGALVVLYARYYLAEGRPDGALLRVPAAFMGAMLGVVLSGNLLLLVVFWELTSLAPSC
jgi:multicomponent K+:H+ antiporter subunit A